MDWSGVDYLWIIVMFLSAVWTLVLTAPIHCRGSIGEKVMECYISPNLMKKQTHLHLGWPEGVCTFQQIFIFGWSIPLSMLNMHNCHRSSIIICACMLYCLCCTVHAKCVLAVCHMTREHVFVHHDCVTLLILKQKLLFFLMFSSRLVSHCSSRL